MSRTQTPGRINRKVAGLGSSIHGGRPTFAIKKTDDEFALFELLQEQQAVAHKNRWQNNRKIQRNIKLVELDFLPDSEWDWDGWKGVKLASVVQAKFDSLKTLLKDSFDRVGKDYTNLLKPGEQTILFPEAVGVKLALAFIGVGQLRRVDKQRALAREIEQMSTEECYYWHSLCRSPSTPNGTKALRTLHTGHIG